MYIQKQTYRYTLVHTTALYHVEKAMRNIRFICTGDEYMIGNDLAVGRLDFRY